MKYLERRRRGMRALKYETAIDPVSQFRNYPLLKTTM